MVTTRRSSSRSTSIPPKPSPPTPSSLPLYGADFLLTALIPFLTTIIYAISFNDASTATTTLSSETIFILLILLMLLVLIYLAKYFNDAMFNICDLAVKYAANGMTKRSVFERSVVQFAGGLTGALAAQKLLPPFIAARGQSLIAATQPGIDVIGGATSEFMLSYIVTLIMLATERVQNGIIKFLIPQLAVAAALKVGAHYSGPALNPAAAASWTLLLWDKQSMGLTQHLIIFWVAPIIAAMLAKWTDIGIVTVSASASASAPKKNKRKSA